MSDGKMGIIIELVVAVGQLGNHYSRNNVLLIFAFLLNATL